MRQRKTSRLIVLDQNDKVLLLHFVHKDRSYWATPGGEIEANETPIQALIRELHEELGAKVNEADIINFGAITEAVSNHRDLVYVYFWHDKKGTVTGCYEGAAKNYDNVQEVLKQPKIMDSVRWALVECQKRSLLKK